MNPTARNAAVQPLPEVQSPPNNGNYGTLVEVPATSSSDLWNWLWLLWGRRRFLARVVIWGAIISAAISLILPKRYESTTRLMPPDSKSGSGLAMLAAMSGKASSFGLSSLAGDLLGMGNSGALFVDMLRSRTVEDRIVDRFDLRKVYGKKYGIDARKRLNTNTEIAQDRKSEVITISVSDSEPRRAEQIAQAYVEELDRLVAQVSTSSARRERIFIEDRLKGVKRDLDQASQEFSQYASKNTTLDITTQGKAMVEGAARLQGELIAAQSQLEGLEQIYTPNNIRVRSLHARIAELEKQLQKIGGNSTLPDSASTSSTINPALPSSTSPVMDENNPAGFPSIRQLPLLGVRWADLYREAKIQETVFEFLTQQYELAKIQEAKEIPTVKVLDAADFPERRSFPRRTLIVILASLASLVLGSFWVVGKESWNRIDAHDTRKALAIEVATTLRTRMIHTRKAAQARWNNGSRLGSRNGHSQNQDNGASPSDIIEQSTSDTVDDNRN